MPAGVRFTLIDETIYHVESAFGPWNMQVGVGSSTPLDPDRLGEAILAACRRHPMCGMRMHVPSRLVGTYEWEPFPLGAAPLEVVDCPDEEAAELARTVLLSRRITLEGRRR